MGPLSKIAAVMVVGWSLVGAAAGAAEPAGAAEAEAAKKAEAETRKREEAQKAQKMAADARALQTELQKVTVSDLDPASDGPAPPPADQKAFQIWHRKQHIRTMAGNFERQSMACFAGDLELIRQTCGSLPPDLRRRALEAGTLAVRKAALAAANAQSTGRKAEGSVAEEAGIQAVRGVIENGVPPQEWAAYETERRSRAARLRQRAQVTMLAFLDAELELSADQRTAIAAALDKGWQDTWTPSVTSMGIHHGQFAPDFAADCIVPSLSPRQQAAWKTWCSQRSWKTVLAQNPQLGQMGWHGHGRLMGVPSGMQPDAWWLE